MNSNITVTKGWTSIRRRYWCPLPSQRL